MAFNCITIATILAVISLCHGLPVKTSTEERSKSEISELVPESVKEIAVTVNSVTSEETTTIVPVIGFNSVTDGHKILKRSPRAGVINVDVCPTGEFLSIKGCVKCDGDCNNINDSDYSFDISED